METNNEVKKQKNKPKYATRAYVESRFNEIMQTVYSYGYDVELRAFQETKKNVEASKAHLWACMSMCVITTASCILTIIFG